jgi:hypothetical protein
VSFRTRMLALAGGVVSIAAAAALLAPGGIGFAADHLEPPARSDPNVDPTPDAAADIADIYVWHTATTLTLALTFAGPQSPTLPPAYDRDVLYTINISNAGSPDDAEFPIEIRFGQNGPNFGVQITGVPGAAGPIVGPVETDLRSGAVIARAGLFDDPFFFDSQGLRETRATGTLSFNSNRDFFSARNVTAVVIEMPRSAVENGRNRLDLWATADRFGGQI